MPIFACFCGKLRAPVCDAQTARAGLRARRALYVFGVHQKVQQLIAEAIHKPRAGAEHVISQREKVQELIPEAIHKPQAIDESAQLFQTNSQYVSSLLQQAQN